MTSTFHGLETAKRALNTQQSGLYTTGNNVANANTPGYTRQRINMRATEAYPPASMNRPQIPGQIGTGVTAGEVHRVREFFLDGQFRKESAKLGYYGTSSEALSRLEDILNETGKDSVGISKVLGEFWQSLQDLSVHPENDGAREVVLQRGHAVADTFNYIYQSIQTYREDLGLQIETDQEAINSILKNIDALNKRIAEMEPLGFIPNNLYDERDLLVDELSKYMDIQVIKEDSYTNSTGAMEGIYKIMVGDVEVVNRSGYKELDITMGGDPEIVTGLSFDGNEVPIDLLPQGKLKSLIENYGYGSDEHDSYLKIMNQLDDLANQFAKSINEVHKEGKTKDGSDGGVFFTEGAGAKGIKMELTHTDDLAASKSGAVGESEQALAMADSFKDVMTDYQKIIGKLGVEAQYANRQKANAATLLASVDDKRLSVSTVSLDEEIMNMIKFQHAYNAAARNITVVDEMLDKIINGMGIIGR
ncbi:flagellar hook-associated protein 1 [Siminovitchia terrae]|uniref:Flagellar hook-associated protein 1 n=1 Tax=Siminovitchia terrae TaxID=1914933 RepID=A0A429X628_SIMTE|nr:flagellar hook-associated protein FlgK [Siminovitchia terrae]RST58854.1 flagellar hook-associated protein FlgK [Siminovitchia terrae]GIN89272.1 flagellar hook-associated protein 1 [Siminovitchia terrae]GIN95336.1 flagellar hook-associated protein 1 [Siminovitchia terrae]